MIAKLEPYDMIANAGKVVIAALLFVALSGIANGQEHKGVTYKLPAGWQEGVEGEAKVFAPKNLKEGEAVAVILTPAVPATDEPAKKQFETLVAAANADAKVTGQGEVAVKSEGGGTVCVQAFEMESSDVGKHSRIYAMVLAEKKRALAIVIIKPESAATKHQDDITNLLSSFKIKNAGAETTSSAGGTPTGNTPTLYPGMPGWLPSGKGLPIPESGIVNGKPQGVFWTTSYGSGTKATMFVFLPSGIHASNPRFGGGKLFDAEGQKAQPGVNGVGPWSISGGKMTRKYDTFSRTETYTIGKDASGAFFKEGAALFRPLDPMTKAGIVGTWRFPGRKYVFNANGTYEFGQVETGDGWAAGSNVSGTYTVDGYLVVMRQKDGPTIITPMGTPGPGLMIVNGVFYKKG